MVDYKKRFKKLILANSILLGVLVLLLLLQLSVKVCEYFSRTFARAWITLMSYLFGWIPLSFYELFLLTAVVFVIWVIVLCVKRFKARQIYKAVCILLVLLLTILGFAVVYTMTAGFAYNRQELPIKMYDYSSAVDNFTREQAIELTEKYIENLNQLYVINQHDSEGYVITDYSWQDMRQAIDNAYKPLVKNSDGYFSSVTPNAKKPVTSWFFSQFGISGLFFAPFGEVNVNSYEYGFYLPVTMSHEIAHAKGVMKESDANTVARYVLFTSEDSYLQYCIYLSNLSQVLKLLRLYPDTEKLANDMLDMVNDNIINQYNAYVEYWSKFDLLNGIGEFFNNLYLKLFGQGGTASYNPPANVDDSGEVDGEGNTVWNINSFSSAGNLIVQLYLDDMLNVNVK